MFPAEGETDGVAKAAWSFDKAVKNFQLACWRHRAYFVGHLSVRHGTLVQEDATDARDPAQMSVAAAPPHTAAQLEACKPFWAPWLTKPRRPGPNKRGKGRSAFFVVWVGRRPGLYTTWDECKAAVVGVEGAKFKGFDLLEDAKRAWRDGARLTARRDR